MSEGLLRLAKYGDAEIGSAGVSPAVARASLLPPFDRLRAVSEVERRLRDQGRLCQRVCWGGTPQQLRPGRPRYIKQCHPILQASVVPFQPACGRLAVDVPLRPAEEFLEV